MKKSIQLFGIIILSLLISCGSPIKKQTIVIDAGHGGVDKGALVDSIQENEFNLNIAKRIKELNSNENVDIVLLRDTDKFISLEERVKMVNELKPDLLISLHHNYSLDSTENGAEIYVGLKNAHIELSKKKANEFLSALPIKLEKRGVKEADFLILDKVDCPAIMIELGFLSNKYDFDYLQSNRGRDEVAESILGLINN